MSMFASITKRWTVSKASIIEGGGTRDVVLDYESAFWPRDGGSFFPFVQF